MNISSSTDDGFPVQCDVCGASSIVNVSSPPGDSVCPNCGSFLWVSAIAEISSQHQWLPDVRISRLETTDRESAIRELIGALADAFDWAPHLAGEFYDAVVKREELGSTGIGRGIAVPHASHDKIDHCRTAIGYSPGGIDFNSLDEAPVHTIIMLASPKTDKRGHLIMLEKISRTLRIMP